MKNNLTFFALGLIMLSAQSYASAPAHMEEQIEGQPGAAPGGASFSHCASVSSMASAYVPSAPLAKIYKEQATQTEISSSDDEQVKAQVCRMISSKNIHQLTIARVNKELEILQVKAEKHDRAAIEALTHFHSLLQAGTKGISSMHDEEFVLLSRMGLVEMVKPSAQFPTFFVKNNILEAFKAEGLIK
ncbi:MAG: hypothetical protein P4L31_02880 [Candidatus Babeliales bacterium]|nr:hypothetical protein [Candidatus Babeliales bacterium]